MDSNSYNPPILPVVERQLAKNINKKPQVSFSAFSFLFSEIISFYRKGVNSTDEFSEHMKELGHHIGIRVLELSSWRERNSKRDVKITSMLSFIQNVIWKHLFGKAADSLEQAPEQTTGRMLYIIRDKNLLITKYMSFSDNVKVMPSEFVSGIISGILWAAEFPAEVHSQKPHTTFVIDFVDEVRKRE